MEIPKGYRFFSYDGDGIGRRVGRAILANDIDELRHTSHLIEAGHALVQRWVKDRNGIWINGGGDEGNAAVGKEYVTELEQLRKDYEYLVGATISVGVGKSPSQAGRALLIAKLKGKNRIVVFKRKIEKEIKAIKSRAKKGAFKSMEEHKLASAYLEKGEVPENNEVDCPYCEQSDGMDPDHCKWCHDLDAKEGEETCPYCKGSQNDPAMGEKMPEIAEEDCPFCNEMDQNGQDNCPYCNTSENPDSPGNEQATIAPNAMNPSADSHNDPAPAGSDKEKDQYDKMGMNPPIIGKPNPAEEPPIGQNPPMDVVPKQNDQSLETPQPSGLSDPRMDASVEQAAQIDPEDNHSKGALQAIAQQIETEGTPPESKIDAIDDSDMPTSTAVEGNISRPEDFGQNVPQDMGAQGPASPAEGNDEPDLSDVLEEGLDHEADGIQKEKAIRAVSQALMQFKGCKQELENIKMQSPQLYQASIGMLKAMIEMAGLLGLGQSSSGLGQEQAELGQGSSVLGQEQAALMPEQVPQEEQNDEWHDPFPTHPDHGGEGKPGHAASPKNPKKEGDGPPQL